MAIPFSEFPENPLNFKKFKKNPKNQNLEKRKTNPNLKSIWALLSSIFIYISAFYIFNLSPSTLICTVKFWFFISNTLILIIAVDFAAFSSSKQHDFYEEYVIKDTTDTSSKGNIGVSTYVEHAIKDTAATSSKGNIVVSTDEEHAIKDIAATSSKGNTFVSTYEEHVIKDTAATSSKGNVSVVPFENTASYGVKEEENTQEKIITAVDERLENKREQCVRSNSKNVVVVAAAAEEEEGRVVILQRTFSERYDREEQRLEDEKLNEFSRMSNEELNRRVEEFIRRFNRQIRLQAVRNRHNLEISKIH